MPSRRLAPVAMVAALLALGLTGCEAEEQRPGPPAVADTPWPDRDPELVIDVEAGAGSRAPDFVVTPSSASVGVVTAGGGRLRLHPGPAAGDVAALFPAPEPASRGRLAVLRVDPGAGVPLLEPGDREFQLGLDLVLPGTAVRTDTDDGDNLLQRGLFGDEGQLKLQVDGGEPSCRVAGDDGEVTVDADTSLATGEWFRLRCQRTERRLTLYVGRIGPDGLVTSWTHWSEDGRTGTVEFADEAAVISVGGKLNAQGGVVPDAPDQFSGALAHVVYEVR